MGMTNQLRAASCLTSLSCTGDPPRTSSANTGPSTDACVEPDSLQNRLLQRCAIRRSSRHHSEAAASTKQRGENRKSGATTVSCQLAAAGAAWAAGGTTHHVQAGRTDLQDTTDVSAGVSEPPHHDTQQHVVTAIVISSITGSSFRTNVFRQTFLQHCSAILSLIHI